MRTFAVKTRRKSKSIRRSHPSRIAYQNSEARAQQAKIHNILHATGAQAKLTVGQPNDKYEQEADSVANNVMQIPKPKPKPKPQRKTEAEKGEGVQAKPKDGMLQRKAEDKEEETLQTRPSSAYTPAVEVDAHTRIQSLNGGGKPLLSNQRNFYESRMGYDFSRVRIHTDSNAADTAQSVQARAFTFGNNIVFNTGQYVPNNHESKHLLAHELTHVVQQGLSGANNTSVQRKPDKEAKAKEVENKTNFLVDFSVPGKNPRINYNKTADQLNAWETAVFKPKINFEFNTNSVSIKGAETGSYVSSLSMKFVKPQFNIFIARHLKENASNKVMDRGTRITWRRILSRVRKHAFVHLYLYRKSSMKMEKELMKAFADLPTKDKPWAIDNADLDEYVKLLGSYWIVRVHRDLIKTTCSWEKLDYPRLLKGINSVSGSFKVSCQSLPKLPPTPLRPIKITVKK